MGTLSVELIEEAAEGLGLSTTRGQASIKVQIEPQLWWFPTFLDIRSDGRRLDTKFCFASSSEWSVVAILAFETAIFTRLFLRSTSWMIALSGIVVVASTGVPYLTAKFQAGRVRRKLFELALRRNKEETQ